MNKLLTAFCFTDIHCQQSMLDMPTVLRDSAITAADNAVSEFGFSDITIVGGDNISDYPYWNRSCALPLKSFEDIKNKIVKNFARTALGEKVLYVSGNNDMILGDKGTSENLPYNTTDFYHSGPMILTLGELSDADLYSTVPKEKPWEKPYLNAFHYKVNGVDFIGLGLDPDTAYNSHDGYYSQKALSWLQEKLGEIDPFGTKPIFVIGHLAALCRRNGVLENDYQFETEEDFFKALKGHKNLFYLYGHVHGEEFVYTDSTANAVIHSIGKIEISNTSSLSNETIGEYETTFVHMGGLRPFKTESFEDNGISGHGGEEEIRSFPKTGTPKLAQYLVLEIYSDKVIFHIRNAGYLEGYTFDDKPSPYTVYFQK